MLLIHCRPVSIEQQEYKGSTVRNLSRTHFSRHVRAFSYHTVYHNPNLEHKNSQRLRNPVCLEKCSLSLSLFLAHCHCNIIQMQMFEDGLECRYSSLPSFACLYHPSLE